MPCLAIAPWVFEIIFGQKFLGAQPTILVLFTIIPGAVFTSLYNVLFNVQGRLGRTGIFSAIMVVINLFKFGSLGAAIGVAISFFFSQGLHIFDQHKFLNISLSKPMTLFLVVWFFSAMQLVIGGEIFYRFLVSLMAVWVLIFIAKKQKNFEKNLAEKNFSKKLAWIGKVFD